MANVLIAEDDTMILKAMNAMLVRAGHTVVCAVDGKEALEHLEDDSYDLVITDLMMPHVTGLEVVKKLRSNPAKNRTGIILVTSISDEDTIMQAFAFGADDYIAKPAKPRELNTRINHVLAVRAVA
ncbi:MAG: response regulator [Bacteroidota bacterium]